MTAIFHKEALWQGLALSIFTTCLVTACSSDKDTSGPEITAPPALKLTEVSDAPLVKPTQFDADRYVRNGVYLMQTQSFYVTPDASADAGAPVPTFGESFSTTNTQVSGVDEADRIEYDGNYLFVADLPVWTEAQENTKQIRILERQADFTLEQVATMPVEADFNIAGMYLTSDTLGVVSHSYQYYALEDALVASSPWHQVDNDTVVNVFDVSQPSAPNRVSDIRIDGGLISSRRIGDKLYIAMQYVPFVSDLPAVTSEDQSLVDIYNAILDVDASELVPQITINGQTSDLFQLSECLLPDNVTAENGHPQMVSMVEVDLANPANVSAVCMLTEAHGLFMSQQNVYLHANIGEETVFHKLSLGESIQYEASGSVPGRFSWRSHAQFKMAEKDGHLLALTSQALFSSEPVHQLNVLAQQGGELVSVATLPNESQPQAIGKPGEDVYAVRFFEDKAYVVTFEQIDPLYVIDIADVTAPAILGELEIPGFSNYLHPMDNGLLLGIGQQINTEAIPQTGGQLTVVPVNEGMKVSLFDVRDPANPLSIQEHVWAQTYTPAEFDHRALTVLKTEQGYRFAFPAEFWGDTSSDWRVNQYLQTLEVNEADRTLNLVDAIEPPREEDYYFGGYEDRSVIHGEHVYFVRGNRVYHALWQTDAAIDGPY